MESLKEIANNYAKKQTKMADQITEKAPILEKLKWEPASHSGWNVAEVMTDVEGAGFTELNAPLKQMSSTTDLVQTPTFNLGGNLEVADDKATMMGGKEKYFADRQERFLNDAGKTTEATLYTNHFLQAAIKAGNTIDAGGTGSTLNTIVIMRMESGTNNGIYDPKQFQHGRLLNIRPINNGALYNLMSRPNVLGWGVSYLGRFGWQNVDPARTVAAIVNISDTKPASITMLDDALDKVRSAGSDTLIMGNSRLLGTLFSEKKAEVLQVNSGETALNTLVRVYNDVPICRSYNIEYNGFAKI